MCSYYFLDVTLNVFDGSEKPVVVTDEKFNFYIKEALKEVFGQFGLGINFNVLKFNSGRGIIRCPSEYYVKFRGALTLFGQFSKYTIHFNIHRSSACLISFISDDTTYQHVSSV